MQMIRHQHISPNPCTGRRATLSELAESCVNYRIGQQMPSLKRTGRNEIDRLSNVHTLKAHEPGGHSMRISGADRWTSTLFLCSGGLRPPKWSRGLGGQRPPLQLLKDRNL